MTDTQNPTVLVSYSHDSPEHEQSVLEVCNRLRARGVDAFVDQFLPGAPSEGWPLWMERQIEQRDFTLMVCTESYQHRFMEDEAPGVGRGVVWEARILRNLLYEDSERQARIVPILLASGDRAFVPTVFRGHFYDISDERGFESLLRHLLRKPGAEAGALGPLGPEGSRWSAFARPWLVPDALRTPYFTGREDLLAQLRTQLVERRRAALSGLGGVGKTQVALEYAARHRDDYPDGVFLVNADAGSGLVNGFVEIANVLALSVAASSDQHQVVAAVLAWLGEADRWLLIFDNVADQSDIAELLPHRHKGHIVITSRESVFGKLEIARALNVVDFNDDEAMKFLLARTDSGNLDAAEQTAAASLAGELGKLPLALEQAAAYIAETGASFSDYLAAFKRRRVAVLERARGLVRHESVAATWASNFAAVEDLSHVAGYVLRTSAFLAPDSIPFEIFARVLPDPEDTLGMGELIRPLVRYSLIRQDAESRTFSVHLLVQEIVRTSLEESERREYVERAADALAAAFPEVEYATWAQCDRLVPHVAAIAQWIDTFEVRSESAGRVLSKSGHYLDGRGRYEEAAALLSRALAIVEHRCGGDGPELADAASILAIVTFHQGRYPDAEKLFERTLDIRERAFGPEHPDVAKSLNNLANVYLGQNRFAEAQPLHERALAIWENAFGPDHPYVSHALNNLAEVYSNLGLYDKAEPLLERALSIRERALGPEHPSTAQSLVGIAAFYKDRGRTAQAEPLYKKALDIQGRVLGPDHPDAAHSLGGLADVYFKEGLLAKAEPLYERALAIRERSLGPDHPEVAHGLVALASFYKSRGRYAEAEPLFERALAIKERVFPPDHPDLAKIREELATLRSAAERALQASVPERPAHVTVRLYGRPEVEVDGTPLRIVCAHKVHELIAFVATGRGKRRGREEIAQALWPDEDDEHARAALRRHLSYLKNALSAVGGSALLLTESATVGISNASEFDLFDTKGPVAGEFLEGYDADWIGPMRERFRTAAIQQCESRIEEALAAANLDDAIEWADRLKAFEPFSETVERRLMVALDESGDGAAALQRYAKLERGMLADIGVGPSPETREVRERIIRAAASAKLYRFPSDVTTFVGRDDEIEKMAATLGSQRLVSCVGPPGVGKTRLASRVAASFAERGDVPAFFVDLSNCDDAEAVVAAIDIVARREYPGPESGTASLERFEGRNCLVVLDNCERVIAGVREIVPQLLACGPGVRALATSRVPLHVEGEFLWNVEPLRMGDAVELFLERARLVRPSVGNSETSNATIAALCENVDGIPLAIELVAARLRWLTLQQLAREASESSGLLAGEKVSDRAARLQATIDSSLDLLDEPQQRLFRRLAPFRGGFDAESVAALAGISPFDAAEGIALLVDHSLVTPPHDDDDPRYSLLQPLREYAWTALGNAGERDEYRERHARYFAERYVSQSEKLNGDRGFEHAGEIEREHDNIVAAMEVLVDEGRDVRLAAELCITLGYLWFITGRVVDGAQCMDKILARDAIEPALRTRLLFSRAIMAREQNDFRAAIERYKELLDIHTATADNDRVAKTLVHLSGCFSATGDVENARRCALEARAFFERTNDSYFKGYAAMALGLAELRAGDLAGAESGFRESLRHFQGEHEPDVAGALCNLANIALAQGELDVATQLARDAASRAERIGARFIVAATQLTLATVASEQGDAARARTHARVALKLALEINDYERQAEIAEAGVRVAMLEGAFETAARLLGAADMLRGRCGSVRGPIEVQALDRIVAAARERLGRSFEAIQLTGQCLSYKAAIESVRDAFETVAQPV